MSEEQFTKLLRDFTRREPFFPFVVELKNGQRILIPSPAICFGGGGAGFLSDTDGFIDFNCDQVARIAPVHAEATS